MDGCTYLTKIAKGSTQHMTGTTELEEYGNRGPKMEEMTLPIQHCEPYYRNGRGPEKGSLRMKTTAVPVT